MAKPKMCVLHIPKKSIEFFCKNQRNYVFQLFGSPWWHCENSNNTYGDWNCSADHRKCWTSKMTQLTRNITWLSIICVPRWVSANLNSSRKMKCYGIIRQLKQPSFFFQHIKLREIWFLVLYSLLSIFF